jgi:uncharacterized protein (DUF4415 family)
MKTNERNTGPIWTDPDDAPKLTAEWFAQAELRDGEKIIRAGRPRSDNPKQAVSLRLDPDVVAWFRGTGAGWQTRINDELRKVAGI